MKFNAKNSKTKSLVTLVLCRILKYGIIRAVNRKIKEKAKKWKNTN